MKKKLVFIVLIIVFVVIGVFFTFNKINEKKRKYDIEQITEFKYFVMKENDKFGVIDNTGKTLIEATYDKIEIPNPSKDVFICYKNDKSTAMNANNQQLFAEYNSVSAIELKTVTTDLKYEKSILKTEKNDKYGLINFSGKEILKTEYDSIEGLTGIEGELQVEKENKFGIVNIKGNTLVKTMYDSITGDNYYNEKNEHGYIVGQKHDDGFKFGYINYKGKLILEPECNDISRIVDVPTEKDTYLIAAYNGQYGVIKNKKNILKCEYQEIEYDKTNKIFIAKKNKNYGAFDITGKNIIPVENTSVQAKGEYIYVEKNNIREVYDSNGNKANVDFNKTIMTTTNNNYRITINSEENGNFYGVINSDKKQIIKAEYLYIEYAYDNYFIACGQNGKLGVLDSNGKEVTDLKYDLVQKIQGKNMIQALYSETNTTEIYSDKMKKICDMQDAVVENHDNYIKLYSNKDIKYIDNSGNEVVASNVIPNKKLYATCKDGKWGYTDSNGKIVVDYEYEFGAELNEYGYGAIKKDGKWGVINSEGKVIVEPRHEVNENYGTIDFIGEYVKVNTGFGNNYYTKEI